MLLHTLRALCAPCAAAAYDYFYCFFLLFTLLLLFAECFRAAYAYAPPRAELLPAPRYARCRVERAAILLMPCIILLRRRCCRRLRC